MNGQIGTYCTSTFFMLLTLAILVMRTFFVIKQKSSRRRCLFLLGATMAYVLLDGMFISTSLSKNVPHKAFEVSVFLFYIAYVILPYAWHTFSRNFVGLTFRKATKIIETIPLVVLLILVISSPFTGALWSFSEEGTYIRGQWFSFYTWLNFFYYIEPLIDMVVILCKKEQKNEPYMFKSVLISTIPLIGAVINNFVLPIYMIYPFQPFCSVAMVLLAFFFMGSAEQEILQTEHQKALQVALEKAKVATQKAEEANRVKTTFLSNVSHDIRTPMNAILNLTKIAMEENDVNNMKEYLNKMEISEKFLLGLINDILDMSKIESGEMILNKETLTRSEFIKTVDTVIAPIMESKKLNFHQELRPGEFTIGVDKLRFNQIFFNLLSNAAKFTPEGGDVWFIVDNMETNNDKLLIRFIVRDTGIGMSEEFQKHVFEPFSRERNELTKGIQGTGLGLPIVKSLVEAMDGSISIKSKLGEGTEVTVLLSVDILSRDESGKWVDKDEIEDKDISGLNILLVEDNELNTYVAKTILERKNCNVEVAENGQIAVDKFILSEENHFDAILMDVRMPVMDGIEATKKIREFDRADAKTVPIIAMTADAFDEERKKTLDAGMNYHLSKPIDFEKLDNVLAECTRKNK